MTRDEWAARISKTWHGGTTTMVDAIIAVARELDQAKDELTELTEHMKQIH